MLKCWSLLWMLFFASAAAAVQAASGQIKKVLPHYLDHHGRHTLAPSLYERDAYQAHLRQHPAERAALRFDVNWKAADARGGLVLRLELRGRNGTLAKPLVLEAPVQAPPLFSKWSALTLRGSAYDNFGDLIAWRATLWEGETLLAEQKSFLW